MEQKKSRSVLKKIPLRDDPLARWAPVAHRAIIVLFVAQLVLVTVRLFNPSLLPQARWPEGLLLVLAAASIISSAVRQLPLQNVMLGGTIIAAIGGATHATSTLLGIPFGPITFTHQLPLLFPPLPWAMPVLWLVAIFTCRGVSRLILRPWRKTRNYGFWLIGITTGLVVSFNLGLDPFATQVKHYWSWGETHAFVYWYSAPWVNFIGWAVTTLVILAFATPSLINKKPVKQPSDYWPLFLWLLLNGFFTAAAVANQLWLAAIVVPCVTAVVAIFAIKGARW